MITVPCCDGGAGRALECRVVFGTSRDGSATPPARLGALLAWPAAVGARGSRGRHPARLARAEAAGLPTCGALGSHRGTRIRSANARLRIAAARIKRSPCVTARIVPLSPRPALNFPWNQSAPRQAPCHSPSRWQPMAWQPIAGPLASPRSGTLDSMRRNGCPVAALSQPCQMVRGRCTCTAMAAIEQCSSAKRIAPHRAPFRKQTVAISPCSGRPIGPGAGRGGAPSATCSPASRAYRR